MQRIAESGANPLSMLTEGLHIHTISVKDNQSLERIISELAKLNVLIEYA